MGNPEHGMTCARELLVKSSKRGSDIPFSRVEFRARLRSIQKEMRAAGIDLLFLSSPESMYYVCGYRCEWYQAQSPKSWLPASGVAMRSDGNDFILFETDDEELMAKCETVAPDIRIFPEGIRGTMIDWIVSELAKEDWIPGTVGLEFWSYRPNRATSELFQRALELDGCEVVDGSDIVRNLRWLKSSKEMEYVEKAARIGDLGMKAAIETMRPGMTELEVYGKLILAMAAAGGENPGITIPVISGERCARSHALASRKRIQNGEIVNIDICGVFNRYHSNMARTFSVGKPKPEVERVVNLSAKSFDLVERVMRPGLPVDEFLGKMREYYRQAGILHDKMWFGGYELGIAFPPDWVGSFAYDDTLDCRGRSFAPGAVVNYESNFYLPRKSGASLLINTIAFYERRAKMLGRIPNELIVV